MAAAFESSRSRRKSESLAVVECQEKYVYSKVVVVVVVVWFVFFLPSCLIQSPLQKSFTVTENGTEHGQ